MNDPHNTPPPALDPNARSGDALDLDALRATHSLPGVEVDMDPSAPVRYGFRIGGLALLVPADRTGEIMEEVSIYPIPYTPTWLPGLINHRGNIVPVFDLESILAGSESNPADARVLVMGHGEMALAVLVTSLPKTVTLGSTTRKRPSIPPALEPFVRDSYHDSDREVWLEIDLDGFVRAQGERLVA